MTDDILPEKNPSNQSGGWIKRYFASLTKGITPEVAADATHKGVRTFLQAALAVVVAAGVGLATLSVWGGAALAGIAAVFSLAQNALGK